MTTSWIFTSAAAGLALAVAAAGASAQQSGPPGTPAAPKAALDRAQAPDPAAPTREEILAALAAEKKIVAARQHIAAEKFAGNKLEFKRKGKFQAAKNVTLIIAGPNYFRFRKTYKNGIPTNALRTLGIRADGTYKYEILAAVPGEMVPINPAKRNIGLDEGPAMIPRTISQSGSFAVKGGKIVKPNLKWLNEGRRR